MRNMFRLFLLIIVFQILIAAALKFPALGMICYLAYMVYCWWKMKQLSTRQPIHHSRLFRQNKAVLNKFIDAEYTEREVND